MEFVSIGYLCFLAAALVCFRTVPPRRRAHLLLVASYAFYCTWSVHMAMVLLLATTVCYFAALQLESLRGRRSASTLTFVTVAALVALLAFFKIRPLLCVSCNPIIPLGISYYTFRLISYLLDVYWGKQKAVREFVPFATYVAFFPQLIAGPIQRESAFLPQLETLGQRDPKILEGSLRMAIGFAKKCLVADNLGLFVGWAYSHLHAGSALPSLVALYLYPLQLYADFSGLVDIAIGSGLLLGLEAPENFDVPFSAKNITEFWRRWHMTLTSWLRDYVFMPMRMLTRDWGEVSLCVSLTVNMLLIALWHGFTLGFLVYGLFHSVFLIAEVLTASWRKRHYSTNPGSERLANIFGPIYVFHVVAVGSVLFRAPSLGSVAQLFAGLGSGIHQIRTDLTILIAPPNHNAWIAFPAYLLITLVEAYRRQHGFQLPTFTPRYLKWSVYGSLAAVWILIGLVLLGSEKGSDPFVYALF